MKIVGVSDSRGGLRDRVVLDSGRMLGDWLFDALSVMSDGKVYYGFDGSLSECEVDEACLTVDERREIAEEMISRWKKWGLQNG